MRDEDLRKAAAILGRKGGKVGGKSKARTGISERMKRWWASPAAAHRRKKTKPQVNYAEEKYTEENRTDPGPNGRATKAKSQKQG